MSRPMRSRLMQLFGETLVISVQLATLGSSIFEEKLQGNANHPTPATSRWTRNYLDEQDPGRIAHSRELGTPEFPLPHMYDPIAVCS
jgi:hypothetical protein